MEQAFERLSALKNEAETPAAAKELKAFLKNRSNLVVAKAAKITGQARTVELVPDLIAAFNRLLKNPHKLDKGCAALVEIVTALYEMDHVEPEIYLLGLHHVQMEGSYGPPVDAAAKLRGLSALGLARTRHPYALEEIIPLLVDDWPQARIGAIRALASNGGQAGALLLKLRVLTGETEPDVLAECFSGLLSGAPENAPPFVARYIDSADVAVAEAALFALGSSRLPQAFDLLKQRGTAVGPLRKSLLLAIAMIRSEEAIEFLLSLLPESNTQMAKDLIAALAQFRNNERVRSRVEVAVSSRDSKELSEAFRQQF
jgi:hypothetical protein